MDTEFVDDSEWAAIEQALQAAQNNNINTTRTNNYHNNSRSTVINNNTGKIIQQNTRTYNTPAASSTQQNTANQSWPRQQAYNNTAALYNARSQHSDPRPPVNSHSNSISPAPLANTARNTKYSNAPTNNGGALNSPRLLSTSQLLGRSSSQSTPNTPPVSAPKSSTVITINGNVSSTVNSSPHPHSAPSSPSLNAPRPTPINSNAPHGAINSPAPSPSRPISAQSSAPLNVGPLPVGTYEFSLVTRDRFLVQHVIFKNFQRIPMAITHPNFVRLLSSLPTAKYDDESERWTFELAQHDHVLSALKQHHVNVTRLPDWIFKAFVNSAKNSPSMVWTKLPDSLVNQLLPFQSEGIQFVVEKAGRALIGDEMGLGKTIQAIGVAAYYRDEWPLLIITPSSLRLQWAEQLERWLGDIPSTDINVVMTGKCDVLAPVNIISYDLVAKLATKIEAVNFKVVICDESHFLKRYSAKRTQAVIPILQRAKRAVLLTGTPAVSRPVELFSQLSAIRTDLFQYFPTFGSRYCNGHKNQFQRWDYNGNSHLKELNCLLSESVMIRRLKSEVLTQLPAKLRQKVSINIPAKQQKMIKKISNELNEIKEGLQQTAKSKDAERLDKAKDLTFHKIRVIQELFRDTGTAKLPAVLEYITDLLEGDDKFLVFGHHQDVLDGISHFMNTHRIDHIQIDGRTPGHARHELVNHFQNDVNCRVGVLSMTAAGTGLTLTAANTVIFAELFWNPGTLRQCEDRAHRIGQVSSVNVHYLVAAGTIDEMIWDLVDHKLEVLGEALNGKEDKLEVDETLSRDCNLDSITANSFIEYLLEKVDSYDERKTAMQKRQKIRERVKKMREKSESDDDEDTETPVKRVTPTGGKKRIASSDTAEDLEVQSPLKKSHVSLDKFVYRAQPARDSKGAQDAGAKQRDKKELVPNRQHAVELSSDDHDDELMSDDHVPVDDHVSSLSDSSDSDNELKQFKKTVQRKRLQRQREAMNSQSCVTATPEKDLSAPNKEMNSSDSASKSKLLKFAFRTVDES